MNNVFTYISYSMGTLFIVLGLAIIFTNIAPNYLPEQFKIMMGIVLLMYGVFRLVSTKLRNKNG
ncbi:hypothetical protein [Rosettibacter firmus]|uniref:hypothetical protein n=1 Tax=Rosettibacter firmus TaxID=3111522 RepID=UPI00336BE1FD